MKRLVNAVLLIILTGIMLFASSGCSKRKEGVLRVGMECNYPPFNWAQVDNSNGAVKISGDIMYAGGYDVEIAKKIAEGLNMELEIVKMDWDALLAAYDSSVVDIIICGMTPTEERRANMTFSDPYYTSELIIVVDKNGPYANAESLEDFKGAKIAAQQGTTHDTVALDQIPEVQHMTAMADFASLRLALESGIIDGYIAELPEGKSVTKAIDSFSYVEFEEGKGFNVTEEMVSVCVGMAKGKTDLVGQINDILATISKEDRLAIMLEATENQPEA